MPQGLRILTWNIGEALVGTIPTIAATLNEFDADLVFLNEIMRNGVFGDGRYGDDQTRMLAEACGYPFWEWTDTAGLDNGSVKGVGLLSRHPLSHPARQPAIKDWPGGNYLALEVQADIFGKRWFLYTLRFSTWNEANNRRHCQLLRDRILQLPADAGVIAAGDFNGGAHRERLFRDSGATDETIVQRLTAPIQDLIDQTGMTDTTAGLGLQHDLAWHTDPGVWLPPYSRATDLILFRAPLAPIRVVEDRANIGAEAHPFLFAELGQPGSTDALATIIGSLIDPIGRVKPPRRPRRPTRIFPR